MINELYEICQELKSTSGKNAKKAILEREKNNEAFKQYLIYILHPLVKYGLQSKKISKFLGEIKELETNGANDLFSVFEYLKVHNTGTDLDAQKVAFFIDSFEDENIQQFILESVTKKIKLGITAKSVNEVYGASFIELHEVMLAKPFEEHQHKVEGKEFVLTEKIDGQRATFIKNNGIIVCKTREGHENLGLDEITNEINQLPDGVYDGELVIKNYAQLKDREVLQETLKITRSDGKKSGLDFKLFDALSVGEFESGKSKNTYIERREHLTKLISNRQFEHVQLLPILYQGKDLNVIPSLLKKLEDEGKEGLMLNIANAPYECKRTDKLLKVKSMKTFDEFCVDVFEGEGKYKGMLGGIIVNYKGFPLKVGSGFTDADRELYWNNPELIIGKVVEVQYFRESKNESGGLSVSFPVFVTVREKTESSYN